MMPNGKRGYMFRAPESLAQRKSYNGKKRKKENKYRTEFMRDRDRLMYCSSFRRLDGKTQIYRTGGNDHQRNRMTHTLEVAQLSRTIAAALKLDCDLAEAIALGHDIGHAPFGHAGEEVLHRIMMLSGPVSDKDLTSEANKQEEHGESTAPNTENTDAAMENYLGFKHNIQSVRIITEIDNSYEDDGLDLTNFTLWGIMHHSEVDYTKEQENPTDFPRVCPYGKNYGQYMSHNSEVCEAWSFEAFVVKRADEIAQWHHDLEDALRGNAMTSAEVYDTVKAALWDRMSPKDRKLLNSLATKNHIDKPYLTKFSHVVIATLVNWLIACSKTNLSNLEHDRSEDEIGDAFFLKHKWTDASIKYAIGFSVYHKEQDCRPDADVAKELKKHFNDNIREKIHHSQPVERMNAKGKFVIEQLFKSYYSAPQQLPTSIIIQYLLELEKENKIPGELKGKVIKSDKDKVVTIGDIVSSWDKAWDAGTGAVRICFKKMWAVAKREQKILLMRKICDHIAGMTDHFALEEYKNLCG